MGPRVSVTISVLKRDSSHIDYCDGTGWILSNLSAYLSPFLSFLSLSLSEEILWSSSGEESVNEL